MGGIDAKNKGANAKIEEAMKRRREEKKGFLGHLLTPHRIVGGCIVCFLAFFLCLLLGISPMSYLQSLYSQFGSGSETEILDIINERYMYPPPKRYESDMAYMFEVLADLHVYPKGSAERKKKGRELEKDLARYEAEAMNGPDRVPQKIALVQMVRAWMRSDYKGRDFDFDADRLYRDFSLVTYTSTGYWDQSYKNGRYGEMYDWYSNWVEVSQLDEAAKKRLDTEQISNMADWLRGTFHPKMRFAMIGCGNSDTSQRIYEEGITNIINVDASPTAIFAMRKKYPHMPWLLMDITDPSFVDNLLRQAIQIDRYGFSGGIPNEIPAGAEPIRDEELEAWKFDLVMEKGMIDAMLTGRSAPMEETLHKLHALTKDENALLGPESGHSGGHKLPTNSPGLFISVSHSSNRMKNLSEGFARWVLDPEKRDDVPDGVYPHIFGCDAVYPLIPTITIETGAQVNPRKSGWGYLCTKLIKPQFLNGEQTLDL